MDFTQKTSSANCDGKLQVMSNATEELKAKMEKFNTTVDTIAAVTGRPFSVDTQVNAAVKEIAKVEGDIVLNKQLQETRYAAVQQQMATLTSVRSGTSSGFVGSKARRAIGDPQTPDRE